MKVKYMVGKTNMCFASRARLHGVARLVLDDLHEAALLGPLAEVRRAQLIRLRLRRPSFLIVSVVAVVGVLRAAVGSRCLARPRPK